MCGQALGCVKTGLAGRHVIGLVEAVCTVPEQEMT